MLLYSYLSLPYHQWVVDVHIAENIVLKVSYEGKIAILILI